MPLHMIERPHDKARGGLKRCEGERMSIASIISNLGIGFIGLLTIAFIVLKLTGFITWSWWWVLSPPWITLLVIIAILMIILVCHVVYKLIVD